VSASEKVSPPHAVVLGKEGLPPILMLHGWGQTLEIMAPLGEKLARNRPVYLIDLPGFGGTPWLGKDWGTYDYAKYLIGYLNTIGISEISLLGHSFGGRISLQLASHWPDRIRDVVLVSSAGLPLIRTPVQRMRVNAIRLMGKLFSIVPSNLGEALGRWHRNRFGSSDYKNAGVLRNTLIKTVTEDQTENASRIKKPTLLLWGELDNETPVNMAERLHELIAGSTLEVLPGRNHYPFLGNDVYLCAEIIKEFLTKQDRATL